MAGQCAKIEVHVQPGAKRNEVLGFRDGALWVRISAQPVEGKANRELVKLLSDILGVARSCLSIERGAGGRYKSVAISGLEREQAEALLSKAVLR